MQSISLLYSGLPKYFKWSAIVLVNRNAEANDILFYLDWDFCRLNCLNWFQITDGRFQEIVKVLLKASKIIWFIHFVLLTQQRAFICLTEFWMGLTLTMNCWQAGIINIRALSNHNCCKNLFPVCRQQILSVHQRRSGSCDLLIGVGK